MDFKLNLFSEDDWKKLENTLVHALVRAARVIAKEGTVAGWKPAVDMVTEPAARAPAHATSAPYSVPEPVKSPPPPPPGPLPRHVEIKAKKERRQRRDRDLSKIIKTIPDRPHGYIDRPTAIELCGGDNSAQVAVSSWVYGREVPAVIVVNEKPPSKGLHGRIFIDKEALLRRNEKRLEYVTNPKRAPNSSTHPEMQQTH